MEVEPLSQTSKRPGARDISDLKARLGLKKGGGDDAAKPASAPGGIVPPPGANLGGGAIPAPPGMSPPQPQVPSAQAPFGAPVGHAPAQAPVTAQPDIVVVNDGKPVESVEGGKGIGRLAKVVAVVLLPLAAGLIIGKVSESANHYNKVIADSGPIKDDVRTVRRGLTDLQAALEGGKKGGKFSPGDEKLTEALEAVPAIVGNDKQIYQSALYQLKPGMVAEIYGFYADIHLLNRMLKEHISAAKSEAKALEEGMAKFKGFNPMQFGALLDMPTQEEAAAGQPVTLKMVKLGTPICEGETKPSDQGCPPPKKVAGFRYQTDQTQNWQVKKMAPAEGETIPDDSLVMLNPESAVLQQIVQGGDATVAQVSYEKRITAIDELVTRMLDKGKMIETVLNEKANESEKFTFFL